MLFFFIFLKMFAKLKEKSQKSRVKDVKCDLNNMFIKSFLVH